jgi:hypothetical protein
MRRGRTVVRVTGPDAPMIVLTTTAPLDGDTVRARKTTLVVEVSGGEGQTLVLFHNGEALGEPITIDADPFRHEARIRAPRVGEDRYRAEVHDVIGPVAITSHVWITRPVESGGCQTAAAPHTTSIVLGGLGMLAIAAMLRRSTASRSRSA